MLAVSPVTNGIKDEKEGAMEGFLIGIDEFPDFSDGNLLDRIDFDNLFVRMDSCDVLPDLEMDPEMFAEFSSSGGEESEVNTSSFEKIEEILREKKNSSTCNVYNIGEEIASKREESIPANRIQTGGEKIKKPSSKNTEGKRKVKVDWTPELHRRFVQAVEQLGVDKAVPSRILELMGIDCLTRHNIASHLQKYRSHRKHLLAREAEAANWSQRRQMYASGGGRKKMTAWVSPISAMGFPPIAPPTMQHFRPLHVWGHPSIDKSSMHMWPKHLITPSPSPPPTAWVQPLPHQPPVRPLPDPSIWHQHHQRVPNSLPPVPHFFPQLMPTARFPSPSVTGIPPSLTSQLPAMHGLDHGFGVPARPTGPQSPSDFHPSKESIDAAIGDVLSKPWSPLPLGLKPPSVDGVLVELQRQGISNIPPSCA